MYVLYISEPPPLLFYKQKVITPSQSEGFDGCEQPQGLPGLKFNHSLELAVLV
jgi:hypothetical protein